MAIPSLKSTYTLDLETMSTLERMAKNWGVSKSEALRRAIHSAAAGVPDSRAEALSALTRLQKAVARAGLDSKAWAKQARGERRASSIKRERVMR